MINYSNRKAQRERKPHRNQPGKSRINQAKKEGKTPQPAELAQFLTS